MSERLTDEELAKLEASPRAETGGGYIRADNRMLPLVAEVRAARELLADMEKSLLLYKADRAEFRDQLMEARELLAGLEWKQTDMDGDRICPQCERKPHEPGCKLAAALGR